MKAKILFHSKLTLIHSQTEEIAVAELKVFNLPVSRFYPEGIKYSMFLVVKKTGRIVVGFDNHRPKGHHLHIRDQEVVYNFVSVDRLVDDFWKYVKREGFYI